VRRLRGRIDSYDAFATGKELVAQVDVLVWDCPAARRRVVLLAASPQPFSGPTWALLRERQDSFGCR